MKYITTAMNKSMLCTPPNYI